MTLAGVHRRLRGEPSRGVAPFLADAFSLYLLEQIFFVSLLLAFLNLIPVPPLDGSWILSGLLSESARRRFEKLRPYSLLLLPAIFLTPAVDFLLFVPLGTTVGIMQLCFLSMGFG